MELEILLVEDDEVDREMVKKSLKSLMPNIEEATSGAECITALVRKKFGLILLDYKLPDVDGMELIFQIRKLTDTPIIMITGFGDEDLVRVSIEAGVLDYIPKNKINPEFLTRSILNDLLIHRTQMERKIMELEMEKRKNDTVATLSEIIKLARDKISEYDDSPS